ncbi:MAG: hypothetical protein FWH38_02300, partial [Treponema sp.]|nr:hypothetical protein [Treponema sp.]
MNIPGRTVALVLALAITSGLFPHWGFAQNRASFPEPAAGFGKPVFDYHFSRADRELSPERWLFEARRGIDLALSEWESMAMFDSAAARDGARELLENWSVEELEYRFTLWLTERFFGAETEKLTKQLSALISGTHLRYTYHLDESGNLLREDKTGDPRLVRPDDEERDFSGDYLKWHDDSRRHIAALSDSFETAALLKLPELLACIPGELAGAMSAAISRAAAAVSSAVKVEFENMAAREERIFTGRRTGDIYSLRKKSNDEEAKQVVSSIIDQAQTICEAGIASLQTRIEEASNGSGDLVLAGTEWLEMYREQFERGLKIWEEAEERFFIRRIEWEQDSFMLFQQGEEAWMSAFGRLEDERQKWELQVKALFDSGETLFMSVSENLEAAISLARAEFEDNLRFRTEAAASKTLALIDMYFTGVSAVYSVRENGLFWLQQYGGEDSIDISDESIYQWIDTERVETWKRVEENYTFFYGYRSDLQKLADLRKRINSSTNQAQIIALGIQHDKAAEAFEIKHELLFRIRDANAGECTEIEKQELLNEIKNRKNLDRGAFDILDELEKSADLYRSLYDKSVEMRDNLINECTAVFGSGALKDILGDAASSDDFVLDEYQIALVRAKALVRYWERRTDIAEAVNAYAAETGAGRMTEAEGLLQWENAKAEYEASITAYEAELYRLNSIDADIQDKKDILNVYAKNVADTEEKLKSLHEEYMNFINANSVDDGRLKDELSSLYTQLLAGYKYIFDGGENPFYLREQELAVKIESLEKKNVQDAAIQELYYGNGTDTDSLYALIDYAESIRVFGSGETAPGSAEECGIRPDDPRAGQVNSLITEKDEKMQALLSAVPDADGIAGEETLFEMERIRVYYDGIIRELCRAAKEEAETALAIRRMEIKLLGGGEGLFVPDTYSGADWYAEAWQKALSEGERNSIYGSALEERLLEDLTGKFEELITKRLSVEIESLNGFVNSPQDSIESFPAGRCLADRETALRALEALNLLSGRISRNENYTDGGGEDDIIIAWFVSGGSFFSLSEILNTRELNEYRLAEGIYNAYCNYGSFSGFLEREERNEMSLRLQEFFGRYSLFTDGTFIPGINSVVEALCEGGEFIEKTAVFLRDFDKLFSRSPNWLLLEINGWKDCLIEYAAVYSISSGLEISVYSEYFERELINLNARYIEFEESCNSVAAADIKAMQALNGIHEQLADEESRLLYGFIMCSVLEANSLNEDSGVKHWRQYLYGQNFSGIEEIASANSMEAGSLSDSLEWAYMLDRRVAGAFGLYSVNFANEENENISRLMADYDSEIDKNRQLVVKLENLKNEFSRIGQNYEYSKMPRADFIAELAERQKALDAQETVFRLQRTEYLEASKSLAETGKNYDSQYSRVKSAFNETEEKRHAYDIQDAIRRWASTAYLETGTGETVYCMERLARAEAVLDLLSGMYNDGEATRKYENTAYSEIYSEYEKAYLQALIGIKALNSVESDLSTAFDNSSVIYSRLIGEINKLGNVFFYTPGYVSSGEKDEWGIKDIVTLTDGKLAFNRDSTLALSGIGPGDSEALYGYFTNYYAREGEYHTRSDFQQEAAELGKRMVEYFTDTEKLSQWGLASDYLIRLLADANDDVQFFSSYPDGFGELGSGGTLGALYYRDAFWSENDRVSNLIRRNKNRFLKKREDAWNGLSAEEKADLEFYLILAMNGSANSGFFQFTALEELQFAYDEVREHYKYADKRTQNWFTLGFFFYNMRDTNKHAMNRIGDSLDYVKTEVNKWKNGIIKNTSNISYYSAEYTRACMLIESIQGEASGVNGISWQDMAAMLVSVNKLDESEILFLETMWAQMNLEKDVKYSSVIEGIAGLSGWLCERGDRIRTALEMQWVNDEVERRENEQLFEKAVETFIAGGADLQTLEAAIEQAYGNSAAAWKNHYKNAGQVIMNSLAEYGSYGPDFAKMFFALAGEYADMAGNIAGMGLMAELASRETEWNEQRTDIAEKLKTWRETALSILEKGRDDWKDGALRMEDSFRQWAEKFKTEYDLVSSLWAEAYLSGLEDKEQWLANAAAAAESASGGALLSAIGSEAERFSRIMDTREFAGIMTPDAAEEAERALMKLLSSQGIAGINDAFNAINGFGSPAAGLVRRGVSGAGAWDAEKARIEAAIFAQETNKAIAEREAKKIAVNARKEAAGALEALKENVASANAGFREGMDYLFMSRGQWKKNGQAYVKDIIAGSTLFVPVLYDRRQVPGYADYVIGPVNIKTRLDDEFLEGLESFAIQALVKKVYDEVNEIALEIFGDGSRTEIHRTFEDKKIVKYPVYNPSTRKDSEAVYKDITIDLPVRYLGSGKFGGHIGYEPEFRSGEKKSKEKIFYHQGEGEFGRLMTEYIYWSVIDAQGNAELGLAPWDKRMWDDRGSIMSSPSFRSLNDIAIKVGVAVLAVAGSVFTGGMSVLGAMALFTAINSTDDLMFGALDVAFGYKEIDEAGFEFGKNLALNAASSAGSAVFGGISGISSGFFQGGLTGAAMGGVTTVAGQTATQVAMTAAQTAATGMLNSAIGGMTYSR